MPATVNVATGQTSATFSITTTAVKADTTVTLSAVYNGTTLTNTLVVMKRALKLVKLPISIKGGKSGQGSVQLTLAAPAGGAVVSLSSGSSLVSVPATVTVPQGKTLVAFKIATASVSVDTTVTLSAVYGGITKSAATLVKK